MEKELISIVKVKDNQVQKAVFEAFELIGASKLMAKAGMKILLKPNVLSAKEPEKGVTTNPEIIRAVIRWLKQFNPSKIYCGDSAGGIAPGTTEKALKICGIAQVCEEEGALCIPLEKTERKIYKVENPLVLNEISTSSLFDEVDLTINLPKIKTHGLCILTCCVKNLFGILPLGNKPATHARFPKLFDFNSALCDIYSVASPELTLIDGIVAMEGSGPSNGDLVNMDIVIAGYDPIALDTTVCKITGINPDIVTTIKQGEKRGLGSSDLSKIKFKGESIESVYRKFKLPKMAGGVSIALPRKLAEYVSKTVFQSTVHFDKEKCKVCGTCWKNCPTHAISPPAEKKKGSLPIWHRSKCITCYCCAELCPYDAVDFKVNTVKNILHSWFLLPILLVLSGLTVLLLYLFKVF